jgi:hypothetical protein
MELTVAKQQRDLAAYEVLIGRSPLFRFEHAPAA